MARALDAWPARAFVGLLGVQLACAPSLILSRTPERAERGQAAAGLRLRRVVAVSAKALFGYPYEASRCEPNAELQRSFEAEIEASPYFELAAGPEAPELVLEACFHEADDAANMEGPLILSGLTVGLLPSWYSRELVLDVDARAPDGTTAHHVKRDSYAAVNWLPLTPAALYWNSQRVFRQVARGQFRRLLRTLGPTSPVGPAEP